MGAGLKAAKKLFTIMDVPSEIDPLGETEIEDQTAEDVKGEIEFKDVWFRYPSRPDQWILKGLSMKIH